MTWRWVEDKDAKPSEEPSTSKKPPKNTHRRREFFVKWHEKSYWNCEWISELQLDVHHPFMYRNYVRKYDMEEPPKLEEPIDESDSRYKRVRDMSVTNPHDQILEDKYYKYGIKPEWLIVHRIINHRTMRDGRTLYLVKWRELSYDQATWEEEDEDIPGLKQAIEYYMDLRAALSGDSNRKGNSRPHCLPHSLPATLKFRSAK